MNTFRSVTGWSVMACSLTALLLASGCATDFEWSDGKKVTKRTLYNRLGGESGIRAVIDDFVARTAANENVNFTRKGTGKEWNASPANVAKLKEHLVDLIGSLTGGPQKYTGRSLKESHAGLKITNFEFDWLIGDLVNSLKKLKVPEKDADELVGLVTSTRKDVVEEP